MADYQTDRIYKVEHAGEPGPVRRQVRRQRVELTHRAEDRAIFVRNVHKMLRPGATHLSVSFSVQDREFGGVGKYRQTPLGTTLYFSSEEEIESIYAPGFEILDLRTIEVAGKYGAHLAVAARLERK